LHSGQVKEEIKPGDQSLLRRGITVQAKNDLIDYQNMPDCSCNYVLDYQDLGIKFCQLYALTKRTHRAIAIELIKIFYIFGPSSILQANDEKEFIHGNSKSHHKQIDDEVNMSCS